MSTDIKLFELRDVGTHIPVMAVRVNPTDADEDYPLRRAGFQGSPCVLLTKLNTLETHYDPFHWDDRRTLHTAHRTIEKGWNDLVSGQVIDVEYLLGESSEPKKSDRLAEIGGAS